ncbi:MAG: LLM class flavin-dependent oxidoreductase, partial [Rhodospirillaceae bacterium]
SIAKAADRLGVGAIWLPEHHFLGDYSASAAPDMLLAAVARETVNLRLGFAILPLPIHDPLRIAERLATLDVLSGGRVVWGVGRGVTRTELDGFGVDPASTRAVFRDKYEDLRRLLVEGAFERDGQQFALNPPPAPRLRQGWLAAVSPESFDLAAELGLDVLTGPFKPWPMIKADLARYRKLRPEGRTSLTMAAYCGPDHAAARDRAGPGILWAYRRILELTRTMMVRQVAGYEHYRRLGWVTPLLEGVLSLGVLEKLGLACVGDPAHLAKRLTALNAAGVDRVSLVVGGGDLSAEEVAASLELVMREALPNVVRAVNAGAGIEVPG